MSHPDQQHQQQTPESTPATNYLDLGITLAINNWPAMNLAVQSNWGGPTSADKRDWLCGAISDMLHDRPETDAEDLEDVLIQVMSDEFDVVVEDESAMPVAAEIMALKAMTERGEFAPIQEMWEAWQRKSAQRGANAAAAGIQRGNVSDDGEEDEEEEEEEEEEDGDMDMDEAPALARAPREKVEPEVDDDGFTKVVGKKKR